MRAKCVAYQLIAGQREVFTSQYGPDYLCDLSGFVEMGREYRVLGISAKGRAVSILIADEYYPLFVPLALFEITDPRLTANWVLKADGLDDFVIWHTRIGEKYFLDDLTEGVATARQAYAVLLAEINSEETRWAGSDTADGSLPHG